jgi:hypothetical protein
MCRPIRFTALVFSLLLALGASPALAGDYVQASWPNVLRTMVRFNALDLEDQAIIDEYAIVTECDLYRAFFHDDFKWNQVRQAVRKSVEQNMATFPSTYSYEVKLQLDRYDFDTQLYKFTDKSAIRNVNAFMIYSVEGIPCGSTDVKIMPRNYRAVLASPVYLDGIPLPEKDAKTLLKMMTENKNLDRIVYAKFNLRIVYVEPMRRTTKRIGLEVRNIYGQSSVDRPGLLRLDARLEIGRAHV